MDIRKYRFDINSASGRTTTGIGAGNLDRSLAHDLDRNYTIMITDSSSILFILTFCSACKRLLPEPGDINIRQQFGQQSDILLHAPSIVV